MCSLKPLIYVYHKSPLTVAHNNKSVINWAYADKVKIIWNINCAESEFVNKEQFDCAIMIPRNQEQIKAPMGECDFLKENFKNLNVD